LAGNFAQVRTPAATTPALRNGILLALSRGIDMREYMMWSWISCYFTGHEYSVCCERGRMFLRCLVCGRRSEGWVVRAQHVHAPHQ